MQQRLNYDKVAPNAIKPLIGLHGYVQSITIDERLRLLLELRVSQINGCSYCIDLHATQARVAGESQQRLDCISVWREVAFYTDKERAALSWAEAVTLVSETHVPDEVFSEASQHFSESELVDLTMVVISINAWNRLAISFRKLPVKRSS